MFRSVMLVVVLQQKNVAAWGQTERYFGLRRNPRVQEALALYSQKVHIHASFKVARRLYPQQLPCEC